MNERLKLSTESRNKNEERKHEINLVEFQQPKIKVNDMELHLFKAFEHSKHPSFHEIIGPILAGFIFPSEFYPSGKNINLSVFFFSWSVFWEFADAGDFESRFS